MSAKQKFRSDAFEAIHSSANALFKIGGINKTTMRNFDNSCLAPTTELSAQEIKKIREANKVSLSTFARYLNASQSTVQKWEAGITRPNRLALKLLHIVQKHGLRILE